MTARLVMLGLCLVEVAALAAPRRYAVVIGNNEGAATEVDLAYAERDATRIAEVLVRVGGVHEEDLIVLRGPDRARVDETFDALAERIADDDDGLVFVYYSGHADASALHLGESRLSLQALQARIGALPSRVRVLIVDACRSGALTRVKGAVPAEPFEILPDDDLDSEGLVIITSSSPGEEAQESDRLQGGVFTHHLAAGLLGAADTSGDGAVTLSEAYQYGYVQTVRTTSQAPYVQHPAFSFRLQGHDDIVLTRPDGPASRGARLTLADGGRWIVLGDDRNEVIAEVDVRPGAVLALASGTYTVRHRGDELVREATVRLSDRAEHTLDSAELRPVAWGYTVRKGYGDERRSAGVLLVGSGLQGPWAFATTPGVSSSVGLRADLRQLSVGLHVGHTVHAGKNETLSGWQHSLGAEVEALRLTDVGGVTLGLGVHLGGAGVSQRFRTPGIAEARIGPTAHAGSVARLEVPIGARWLIGSELGLDAVAYPAQADVGSKLTAVVRPAFGLEVGSYVW